MKIIVLSDIHANLSALKACHEHFVQKYDDVKIIILGDYVDYGPRPNETIELIKEMKPYVVLCGNHEKALWSGENKRFSSSRGVLSVKQTKNMLSESSFQFIIDHQQAYEVIEKGKKRILFVHGDMSDPFWGKMPIDEMQKEKYKEFDLVISGHTHIPHLVEIFYEDDNSEMRNKKKTTFLNPGSVGQPRNHCVDAQYLMIDIEKETFEYQKVSYDVASEQSFFSGLMNNFYRDRLEKGI